MSTVLIAWAAGVVGVVVGALFGAIRVAQLEERCGWLEHLLEQADFDHDPEHDAMVEQFRAELDDWDDGV